MHQYAQFTELHTYICSFNLLRTRTRTVSFAMAANQLSIVAIICRQSWLLQLQILTVTIWMINHISLYKVSEAQWAIATSGVNNKFSVHEFKEFIGSYRKIALVTRLTAKKGNGSATPAQVWLICSAAEINIWETHLPEMANSPIAPNFEHTDKFPRTPSNASLIVCTRATCSSWLCFEWLPSLLGWIFPFRKFSFAASIWSLHMQLYIYTYLIVGDHFS